MLRHGNRFLSFLLYLSMFLFAGQNNAEEWKSVYQKSETLKHSVLLTRDLNDKQKVSDSLRLYTKGECSIFMLFTPEVIITFDTTEYSQLMKSDSKNFEDYLYFLADNDIVESLFMLIYDDSSSIVRIDRISTDININFGEVIYSYFPDSAGRISSAIDWYCLRNKGKIVWYGIEYAGFTPVEISCEVYERD